jgi:magnesium-transporting ATPase (P-type)
VAFVSLLLVGGNLGLFLWELDRGQEVKVARTATVNLLMLGEVFYLFNCRRLTASILSWDGLTGNRYVLLAILVLIGLQWLFTYQPTLQTLFHTAALDWAAWGPILAFGLGVLLVVELEKALVRYLRRRDPARRGSGRP